MSLRRAAWLFVALAAGVVGASACEKPQPDRFPCNDSFCHDDQVCASSYTEGIPGSSSAGCVPMPDACDFNPTCDCLGHTICGGNLAPGAGEGSTCGCDDTGCFVDCVDP